MPMACDNHRVIRLMVCIKLYRYGFGRFSPRVETLGPLIAEVFDAYQRPYKRTHVKGTITGTFSRNKSI